MSAPHYNRREGTVFQRDRCGSVRLWVPSAKMVQFPSSTEHNIVLGAGMLVPGTADFLVLYRLMCINVGLHLLATVAVLLSPPPISSVHVYVPQYDSFAFDVCATRSYKLDVSI